MTLKPRLTEEDIVRRAEYRSRRAAAWLRLLIALDMLLPLFVALMAVRLWGFPLWLAFITGFAAGRISGALCVWHMERI